MVGTIITVDIITMEDTITMITIIITEADGAGVVVVHGRRIFPGSFAGGVLGGLTAGALTGATSGGYYPAPYPVAYPSPYPVTYPMPYPGYQQIPYSY